MTTATTRSADDILSEAGASITYQHVPTTFDPASKEWQHIAWRVTITTPRGTWATDYNQGIGHIPQEWLSGTGAPSVMSIKQILQTGSWLGRRLRPPSALDVMACLCMDASALDQTFEEWAGDIGYDTDSRKALATFDACREAGLHLRRILGADLFEELRQCEDIVNH